MRAEINEKKTNRTIEKSNEIMSWFSKVKKKKSQEITKPLTKKEKEDLNKIQSEMKDTLHLILHKYKDHERPLWAIIGQNGQPRRNEAILKNNQPTKIES